MRRLNISLRLIAVLALLVSPCDAQMTLTGAGGTKAAGCSDSNATAWVNAVVAASATVSAAQQTRVCNLIVALKGHSLWTKLDRMWLYASENATQAKIDIVNLATHTVNGSPTFTASQGYTGTGANTDFINTGFIPVSAGGNFSLTGSSLGVYVRNNRTVSANVSEVGENDTNPNLIQVNAFTSQNIGETNGVSVAVASATTSQGFWVISQTSSSAYAFYNKGSSIGSTTFGAGSPLSSNAFYALALNNSGSTIQATTDQIAVVLIGGAFSSGDMANMSTDVNGGYMTALGTNVY